MNDSPINANTEPRPSASGCRRDQRDNQSSRGRPVASFRKGSGGTGVSPVTRRLYGREAGTTAPSGVFAQSLAALVVVLFASVCPLAADPTEAPALPVAGESPVAWLKRAAAQFDDSTDAMTALAVLSLDDAMDEGGLTDGQRRAFESRLTIGDDAAIAMMCRLWSRLPLTAQSQRAFAGDVEVLRKLIAAGDADANEGRISIKARNNAAAWASLFALIDAAARRDRDALLQAARDVKPPATLPDAVTEAHVMQLLTGVGASKVDAGRHIISHRKFDALHALLDLDKALTREATFLRSRDNAGADNADADADALLAARDSLRRAYLNMSNHTVPRLFALNLLERDDERVELLSRYFDATDVLTAARGEAGRRLPAEQQWKLIIEPALRSDLALLDNTAALRAALAEPPVARINITAKTKKKIEQGLVYEGDVVVTVDGWRIACDWAVATAPKLGEGDLTALKIAGRGSRDGGETVRIESPTATITARQFTFHSQPASFEFAGDVRVETKDGGGAAVRLEATTLSLDGRVLSTHSLRDAFKEAKTLDAKRALLPRLTAAYRDDELPDEARYLLALSLIDPHLTWHAPFAPPADEDELRERMQLLKEQRRDFDDGTRWRWASAMTGELWLTPPAEVIATAKQRLRDAAKQRGDDDYELPSDDQIAKLCFWHVADAQQADVQRALKLLETINSGSEVAARARRWATELRRDNTVLTFDAPGGFATGRDGSLVIDVRAAEQVTFKLYRVREPQRLLAVLDRIGEDFIFRDYGLHGGKLRERPLRAIQQIERLRDRVAYLEEAKLPLPAFDERDLAHTWRANVAELPWLGFTRDAWLVDDDDWHEPTGDDSQYFDDDNARFEARLRKRYRPEDRFAPSTWRTDRVVTVPGNKLAAPGAYVLIAEANGQRAVAPMIVDPLSLTLRRARDGVMTMVSDATGMHPLAGARVFAKHALGGAAATDARGVAFCRTFAAGDRAILAHHNGRFAVGGFGRVFDGLYRTVWDRPDRLRLHWAVRDQKKDAQQLAQVYTDRYVVAAYTDRPTYRPGQHVDFKLIVRRLAALDDDANRDATGFRAGDFDLASRLELPDDGEAIEWAIVNPKGRAVATGRGELNDFGTAIGETDLSPEAMVGRYSLRVVAAGMTRIVPDVFAVKYYRRPNFKVTVGGVPDVLREPHELSLRVTGEYYFGKPVAGGKVELRLVRADHHKPLAQVEGELGPSGQVALQFPVPQGLTDGEHMLIATLDDGTGRSVSHATAVRIAFRRTLSRHGIDTLPRFVAAKSKHTFATAAERVVVSRREEGETRDMVFLASEQPTGDGEVTVTFEQPGWYRVTEGGRSTIVFAYGNGDTRMFRPDVIGDDDDALARLGAAMWVNLTDYAAQEDLGDDRLTEPADCVYALFDRQHATVGGTLPVLLYTTHHRARIVLTVEGRTVLDYIDSPPGEKSGQFRVVELPIRKRHAPNFYLQARVVAHADDDGPPRLRDQLPALQEELQKLRAIDATDDGSADPRWCRVDVADPSHKPGGAELHVLVLPEKKQYKPGDEVKVRLEVQDLRGRPRQAELSLAAVDQSVYAFGEDGIQAIPSAFSSPHVERRFMPKSWRSSVGARWSARGQEQAAQRMERSIKHQQEAMQKMSDQLRDIEEHLSAKRAHELSFLSAEPVALLDGQRPAASISLDESALRLRRDFRETAAWLPQIRTDAQGIAHAAFKLPDSLTAYRLSAVALTKETRLGVGRAEVTAALPLSVQVQLPRFAVEKDELDAVALVHNHSDDDRTVLLGFDVTGAVLPATDGWRIAERDGRTLAAKEIKLSAHESAAVPLRLRFDAPRQVRVECRVQDVNDGDVGDAERRTVAVSPLGRPAEFSLNGTFRKTQRIELPVGFVATDLRISVARHDIPHALDSLGYLVEYPHGCVEQTMSRFMPLVMVKHATQYAAIELPANIEAKLPDTLKRGLERLYNFQHPDGSWGWFGRGGPDDRMTIYVLYGLARCRATGTVVDENVLTRGCDLLKQRLRAGALNDALAARAYCVLALAGQVDRAALGAFAKSLLDKHANNAPAPPPVAPATMINAALACRDAGLPEPARALWSKTRNAEVTTTHELALKLTAQVAFLEPVADAYATGAKLLEQRRGMRWAHTRDTAWAIEALANLLQYAPPPGEPAKVTIKVDGETLLNATDGEGDKVATHRVSLDAAALPNKAGVALDLAADLDEPFHFAVTATGVERLDAIEPRGDVVKLTRRYETVDGEPIGDAVNVGDIVAVRLTLELAEAERYLMIEDARPAGAEFADDQLRSVAKGDGDDNRGDDGDHRGNRGREAVHVEFRDDRVTAFFDELPAGTHEFVYYLRAESRGVSHILPGAAYPMYRDTRRGETGAARLTVK